MRHNELELQQSGCIYLIKNLVTGQCYVGQTRLKNPIARWKDHVDSAFCKNDQYHLYCAMRKYGLTKFVFQVIEDSIPIQLLDEKEKEYVEKFDSFNNGYNNTIGGQCELGRSTLRVDQVLEIIEKIKTGIPFPKIAAEYNVGPSTISDINNGDTWNFDGVHYPILCKDKKAHFSESQIQSIYQKIRAGIRLEEIAKEYRVSTTAIYNINNGRTYKHDGESYPISTQMPSYKHLEVNQVKHIIHLLKNTDLSYTKIEMQIGVSRKAISNIDRGIGYLDIVKELGVKTFPIRK